MNVPVADQVDQALRRGTRPSRWTRALVSYDVGTNEAVVTSVVGGATQGTQTLPVDLALASTPGALVPGAIVTVERLTGRTSTVVGVASRLNNTPVPALSGPSVNLGSTLSSDILFQAHDPTALSVSWPAGAIGLGGTRYAVSSGATEGLYVTWTPPNGYLDATDIQPSVGDGAYILCLNRGGVPLATQGGLHGSGLFAGSVVSGSIASGGIAGYNIASGSIGLNHLVPGFSIASGLLVDGSVTTPKLATKAVTTVKIDDFAITSGQILDGTLGTPKYANQSITTIKIAALAVTSGELGLLSVGSGNVIAASLGDSHIATAAGIAIAKLAGTPSYQTKFFLTADDALGTNAAYLSHVYLGTS